MRVVRAPALLVAALAAMLPVSPSAVRAQGPATLEELVSAVVRVKTFINPDGRTVATLGPERQGSGVVIGADGLVVTIGYLMLEAHAVEITTGAGQTVPADVVGYDHESGFGLVKAASSLKVRPMPLGKSADLKENDPVLVASFGGPEMVSAARVAALREFAGSWEYLLDQAIFTAPPHPAWSGAALINREGKLVGVGSLIVGDATGRRDGTAGNMFVPIDRLPPIMAELMADGRVSGPARPWLGLTTEDAGGRLLVQRVAPGGPAEKAGIEKGAVVVGVDGRPASSLADFYRMVWARGAAGISVPLDVEHSDKKRRVDVKTMDRMDHLKMKSTF
jgi:S1-C subfamily serine protease